ncbi:MAG: hypothetical protein AB8B56_11075, partial [Crocinitomicaceae bacterium]
MKLFLFFVSCNLSFLAISQQLHHPSVWPTEYNIQYHITHGFINRMVNRGHKQRWDTELQRFTSSIYDHLTFEQGANATVSYEMASLKFALSGYFKSDFSDFSPERFEYYFKKGKKAEKGTVNYDSIGRITEMGRKSKTSWNSKRKERFSFSYTGSTIKIHLKQITFNYFGNYRGTKINIRYRPVRQKTFWDLTQYMAQNNCTDSVISEHRNFVNARKNFDPEFTRWKYTFTWDSIGRLTHEVITVGADSVYLNVRKNYSDQLLDSATISINWIMKSPPIR